MRVSGLLHRGGLCVVPVGDIRKITAQLFDQGDKWGRLTGADGRVTGPSLTTWAACDGVPGRARAAGTRLHLHGDQARTIKWTR